MTELYQWSVPCTICESPVEHHCNTCGDVFCSNCREIHLKSKATRHHAIVPYSERVEPNESLQCGDHPGFQCGVWCKTCNRAVCSECVTSSSHSGHVFLKLEEKIKEKRNEIQTQFDKCSTLLSDWQNALEESKKLKETYLKDVTQLDKEIIDRADGICEQVRQVEKESRKQLQEMIDASLIVLHDQHKTLADGIQNMEKKIKELENTLRSTDLSVILQFSADKDADSKPPIEDPPAVPAFNRGSLDTTVLKNMLRCLSVNSDPTEESSSAQSKQIMPLLTESTMESVISIEGGWYSPAIACVGTGQAWVQANDHKIHLVNRTGTIQKTVKLDFDTHDMTLATTEEILFPDKNNKCIKSMSVEGDITTLFSTQWEPYGIYCLQSGDIVVSFNNDGRVVQYSNTGDIMKEMDSSLFQHPGYMADSQVNKQLYVCDKTNNNNFGTPGRILALDMNGTLQFTYSGTDKSTFTPVGVCTDQAGHILTTDFYKNTVHILDKGGNFLQYLSTWKQGLTKPVTIDVDHDGGYVWIAEYGGWLTRKVKVVKYTK